MATECLIVTKVEVYNVREPTPIVRIMKNHPPLTISDMRDAAIYTSMEIEVEDIYPKEFTDPITGEHKWIGMTKDVYEKLRLPYDAVDSLRDDVRRLEMKKLHIEADIRRSQTILAGRWREFGLARTDLLTMNGRLATLLQVKDKLNAIKRMSIWQFIKWKLFGKGRMRGEGK